MVWHGFAHANTDDPADQVIQAFQVLDVEGGPYVDAGAEQFFDVLPAFGVARAGDVGMGVFVNQQQAGTTRQRTRVTTPTETTGASTTGLSVAGLEW